MTTTDHVLAYLMKNPRSTAGEVGTVITKRTGRGVANGGGGDYAAQMLLGRMRKAGLVETSPSEGATKWRLTDDGIKQAVDRGVYKHKRRKG